MDIKRRLRLAHDRAKSEGHEPVRFRIDPASGAEVDEIINKAIAKQGTPYFGDPEMPSRYCPAASIKNDAGLDAGTVAVDTATRSVMVMTEVDFEQAAALSLDHLTAWRMVRTRGRLQAGSSRPPRSRHTSPRERP